MDSLRGLAILLVIAFHATTISDRYGLAPSPWLAVGLDFLAPFRMPLLMFLSGMLLLRSLEKKPRQYFAGKAKAILWPYLVWSLIFLAVAADLSLKRLVQVVVMPPTYLWFLWFLFAYYAICWLAFRWRLGPAVLLAVAFVAMFGPEAYRFSRFWYLLIFFVLGAVAKGMLATLSRSYLKASIVALPLGAFGLLGGVMSANGLAIQYAPEYLPMALAGVLSVCILAALVPNASWPKALTSVGKNSIVYYVSHFTVMWVFVAVTATIGISSSMIIGAAAAAAVAAGYMLVRMRVYAPVANLFVFPSRGRVGEGGR
ncbi:acyltransferase family protein [Microbacterium aurantiacum]|uniref:acyltransferase family protein n=1 Tax=Microbacterium aurantiacum TaxID=162393 RepID=UPI003F4977C1